MLSGINQIPVVVNYELNGKILPPGSLPPAWKLGEVKPIFENWSVYPYYETFSVVDSIKATMKDAGHILGSAMYEIDIENKKILFTGDLGNSPSPLLRDTDSIGSVDYIVMESVYGDRNHESKDERDKRFKEIINETIGRGGTLIIPAFSIERTQVLLYELNNLVEKKEIESVPVFVDSPMAIKVTDIYKSSTELFNSKIKEQIQRGDNVFEFKNLHFTITNQESRDIDHIKGPKIILAGSGMSVGGRVVSHEARYLPDARNTILLVGYQSVGSIGRELASGSKQINIHGNNVGVKAKIETIYGFSAHKDSDHLLDFVNSADERLKKVFVVMGELKASMFLAQRIRDELSVKAFTPTVGESIEL
jgi:metallo-beta-lactamase family protein